MSMLSERLQILISRDQRRGLEAEAERRNTSVAAVVRAAIDATISGSTREERRRAFEAIAAMRGRYLPVDALEAIVDEERDSNFALLEAD